MATSWDVVFPTIGEKPHQPYGIYFPGRSFGKTKIVHRSFQNSWYNQWKWLHYDENGDKAYCFVCLKAVQKGKFCIIDSHIY